MIKRKAQRAKQLPLLAGQAVSGCACLLLLLLITGCEPKALHQETAFGFYFDTFVSISAYGVEKAVLEDAIAACADYEALLSKTAAGSDVYRINHAGGAPVTVDARTIAVLQTALEVSRLSGGAFDVTIAPSAALWDFSEGATPMLPDEEALSAAAEKTDYTKIAIEGNVVTLPAGMMLDLGGIAKGYIADEIAAYCIGRGVQYGLLNFGGNVVLIGGKPDKTPYRVGIQKPGAAAGEFICVVEEKDTSIVTSGTYERGFTLAGVTYHHILNPKTGWPIQNELSSVTIVHKSSMRSDALSTACFALGTQAGMALIEKLDDVQAIFVTSAGEILCTSGIAVEMA